MSTPGPNPVDPDEPIEEWRPGTDRDGNEPEDRDGGSDGTRGGREENGGISQGGKSDEDDDDDAAGSGK